jgi:hypothetical protein
LTRFAPQSIWSKQLIESKADCIPNSLARSRHVSNPGCLSESSLRCSASVRTQTLAALNAIRTICPTELRAIQKIRLSRRCGHSNLLLRAMFRHAECTDCAMGASQTDCSGRSAMTAGSFGTNSTWMGLTWGVALAAEVSVSAANAGLGKTNPSRRQVPMNAAISGCLVGRQLSRGH